MYLNKTGRYDEKQKTPPKTSYLYQYNLCKVKHFLPFNNVSHEIQHQIIFDLTLIIFGISLFIIWENKSFKIFKLIWDQNYI